MHPHLIRTEPYSRRYWRLKRQAHCQLCAAIDPYRLIRQMNPRCGPSFNCQRQGIGSAAIHQRHINGHRLTGDDLQRLLSRRQSNAELIVTALNQFQRKRTHPKRLSDVPGMWLVRLYVRTVEQRPAA